MKFKPFSRKQLKVLSWWKVDGIKDKYDAVIADGSVRSGKTVSMSISFVFWAMATFTDCNFALCGKTVRSCRRNVIKPLINMLKHRYDIKDKRSENLLIISKDGRPNTFYIFGGKDESSQDLIQGVTLAGVLFDEVALMPRSFVEQALARCSIEGARFWFNCNPDNPNHWFYREWVLKAPEKHALRLKFLMDDNLSLSDKVKQRYYSLYQGTFYRRFILGEWVIAEGLVYQDYNDHIKEKLWNGNPDELVGTWYISMDYGTINPCSMGLWCVTDNEAIRVDEYYYNSRKEGYQRTDEEHYAELDKLAGDRYIERVIIDPSAASFKATIKRHGKFFVKSAKNDVINGIRTTSQMLSNGRIKIGVKCKASQEEFGMYRWDEKAEVDKVVKENDHAMDDIRYFAYTILRRIFKYND
ncbi:Bacteriophage terminase large (ATPase) subunit and inactivated derivatives [uncultured Ruminococcus sp.]|nr:PBSX family phage terminase large subunit [uncultured Ruminococcus sp.]SCJ65171.1 Bacteriophage terminase large (ATPase) subunit and inactivated derivatives [uncultured Ruminococcus sp.]